MRPTGRGKLESLYFSYPEFELRPPPELDGHSARHTVVIAGAGPVGMTAAIALACQGVPSVVLDRKHTLNDGSRAICISRHSYQLLRQLGAVEPFVRKGLGWTHGRCYYREEMIYRMEMPHSRHERYFPMYNLQQQYIEQFLLDRIGDFPDLIDMRWQTEVLDVSLADDEVASSVATPAGDYTLRSSWLIAADGARSRLRDRLGLRLKGDNLPGHYVIADILMEHSFPTERRCFFESPANPDATILIHRQPDNIWRVDWQLRAGEDPRQAMEEETILARLQSILDMIGHVGGWELEWWSIYTANTLCLDEYHHGRTLFAGDAAHIVPIFGVRGLNNGIVDAVNAAWKLAYMVDGRARESLLDSYTPERRGATLDVFRNAGKSSRFMTPPTRGFALMREAALQLSLICEFPRKLTDPRQVVPHTYRDSPLTHADAGSESRFSGGVDPGTVIVDRRLGDNDYLLDHLGPGFTGIYFCEQDQPDEQASETFDRLAAIDRRFKPLIVSPHGLPRTRIEVITDRTGEVFSAYGASEGTFYLIRPDLYVAARWASLAPPAIERTLLTILGRT